MIDLDRIYLAILGCQILLYQPIITRATQKHISKEKQALEEALVTLINYIFSDPSQKALIHYIDSFL